MAGRKSRRVGKLGVSAGVVRARFEPHVARGGEAGLGGGHVRVNERVKSPKARHARWEDFVPQGPNESSPALRCWVSVF